MWSGAKHLTLFKDQKYAYHVPVTTLTTHPWRVWLLCLACTDRAAHPRMLDNDPLAKIPTAAWIPNVASFQLQLLLSAFDLSPYFKRLCLPSADRTKTLKTVRMELLVIPGRLVNANNRSRLKLPRRYHFERRSSLRWSRSKS